MSVGIKGLNFKVTDFNDLLHPDCGDIYCLQQWINFHKTLLTDLLSGCKLFKPLIAIISFQLTPHSLRLLWG